MKAISRVPDLPLKKAAEDVLNVVSKLGPDSSIEEVEWAIWRADYMSQFLRKVARGLERDARRSKTFVARQQDRCCEAVLASV